MEPNVEQTPFSDEIPTEKTDAVSIRTIVAISRIERLARQATTRLQSAPDADAVASAAADLTVIAELASTVLR